jgi:hypothetical protein
MRNTLNAKYVIGWDLHGYRLRNYGYLNDDITIDEWHQSLGYHIGEVKKFIESKINDKVDNIIISNESIKDLVVNLKNYNHETQKFNDIDVIFDYTYDNPFIKICSSKQEDMSGGIIVQNLIGYYNDDF